MRSGRAQECADSSSTIVNRRCKFLAISGFSRLLGARDDTLTSNTYREGHHSPRSEQHSEHLGFGNTDAALESWAARAAVTQLSAFLQRTTDLPNRHLAA